jgi:hypothetical protein
MPPVIPKCRVFAGNTTEATFRDSAPPKTPTGPRIAPSGVGPTLAPHVCRTGALRPMIGGGDVLWGRHAFGPAAWHGQTNVPGCPSSSPGAVGKLML